jgi:hypothetical protein
MSILRVIEFERTVTERKEALAAGQRLSYFFPSLSIGSENNIFKSQIFYEF